MRLSSFHIPRGRTLEMWEIGLVTAPSAIWICSFKKGRGRRRQRYLSQDGFARIYRMHAAAMGLRERGIREASAESAGRDMLLRLGLSTAFPGHWMRHSPLELWANLPPSVDTHPHPFDVILHLRHSLSLSPSPLAKDSVKPCVYGDHHH